MTSPEIEPAEQRHALIPDACPRCGILLANNVVVVTDPEGHVSARCCTPDCGWRDDQPNEPGPRAGSSNGEG